MFNFEVTVLGASGGPDAGDTQCFMVRPSGSRDLRSICVDGGAGVGQIARILSQAIDTSRPQLIESFYFNDFEPADQFFDPRTPVKLGFPADLVENVSSNTWKRALQFYKGIKEYYITHAHLDHIAAMVMNSPMVYDGECMSGKKLWGLPFTMDAIKRHVFNDLIWPDLLDGTASRLKLDSLAEQRRHNCETFPQWDIIPLKVHHGFGVSEPSSRIYSTIYLFIDKRSGSGIVICGDLEQDHATDKLPLLEEAWDYIAKHIPHRKLKGIIIECSSWTATQQTELYGHMSPTYLVPAINRLQRQYQEPDALRDLEIVITHVKKAISDKDPRLIILKELRDQAHATQLHVRFSIAIQGYTFQF